jgi:hypothetical protein
VKKDERSIDAPISQTLRLDTPVIDLVLLGPTTFSNNFIRDDLEGIRETFTSAASEQAPRPSMTPSSATRTRTRTPSPMTDVRDTSGPDTHSYVLQAYDELRGDLKAAYIATKNAENALEQADEKLHHFENQIGQISGMPATHPPPMNGDQSTSMQRLDAKIHHFEQKNIALDQQVKQYSDLLAQMKITSNLFDPGSVAPGVYQRSVAAKSEKPLHHLGKLRMDLQEAETKVSWSLADFTAKKLKYGQPKFLWERMLATMEPWAPSDDESTIELEDE